MKIIASLIAFGALALCALGQDYAAIGLKPDPLEAKFGERFEYNKDDLFFSNDQVWTWRTAQLATTAIFNAARKCIEVRFSRMTGSGTFSKAETAAILAANGEDWKVTRQPALMDRDYKEGVSYAASDGSTAKASATAIVIQTPERKAHLAMMQSK